MGPVSAKALLETNFIRNANFLPEPVPERKKSADGLFERTAREHDLGGAMSLPRKPRRFPSRSKERLNECYRRNSSEEARPLKGRANGLSPRSVLFRLPDSASGTRVASSLNGIEISESSRGDAENAEG
jgi:hypothetical protein